MKTTQKVLRINNVQKLSQKDMLDLDQFISKGKEKIFVLDRIKVSFSQLLCSHFKYLIEIDELGEIYPRWLIRNNIDGLLGLGFFEGFLPDEIFPMGAGIYDFDGLGGYLLAYPENPSMKRIPLEESLIQKLKAKNGFLKIEFYELLMHLRIDDSTRESEDYFDNQFPKFNYEGFENYFLNWLRGHDFIVEEGKFIVRKSDFDQVA